MMVRPGYCAACWCLAPSDLEELNRWQAAGRVPRGGLRKLGISRWVAFRHRHHPPGRIALTYFRPGEHQRRRAEGQRLARWRWRPGQSGGGRKAKGRPNRNPMRPPSGIAAGIHEERQERRAQWEALHGPVSG
ncbi:MAG: hypothetical protein ACRD13_09420 [Terriglobales bacterium]